MSNPAVFVEPNNCRMVSEILNVHDGDTFHCRTVADEGLERIWDVRIRLFNAPELKDPGGVDAQRYLKYLLSHKPVYVEPYETARSFNRRVMDVWITQHLGMGTMENIVLVSDLMLKAGHGVPMIMVEGLTP